MMRIQCSLFSLWILLSGCAIIAVSGAGGGVAYTITNVAYKTFVYPLEHVESATQKALRKMGIREIERKKNGVWNQDRCRNIRAKD
jgi:hypothetical protein